jgi:hypothetical protein
MTLGSFCRVAGIGVVCLLVAACSRQAFHTVAVSGIGLSGDSCMFLLLEEQGYDKAMIGSCGRDFVVTRSRVIQVAYNLASTSNHFSLGVGPVGMSVLSEREGRQDTPDIANMIGRTSGRPVGKSLGQMAGLTQADIIALRQRFPDRLSDLTEPLLVVIGDAPLRTFVSVVGERTHVFDEAGTFHYATPVRGDYQTIWDQDNHRIVFFSSQAAAPSDRVIGFPKAVKVWWYRRDVTQEWRLVEPL